MGEFGDHRQEEALAAALPALLVGVQVGIVHRLLVIEGHYSGLRVSLPGRLPVLRRGRLCSFAQVRIVQRWMPVSRAISVYGLPVLAAVMTSSTIFWVYI